MRNYEVVFIVHPELEETQTNEVIERVQSLITDNGGSISKVDLWGKRKLAYDIRKQREGFYVMLETQMDPEFCVELERNLRFLEPVMRYLVVKEE